MKLILRKTVPNLGQEGDVVSVKAGYARNFLLPRDLAVEASTGTLKVRDQQKKKRASRIAEQLEEAKVMAGKLTNETLTFKRRASEEGNLFGSVTLNDISAELKKLGAGIIPLDSIRLGASLKMLGESNVDVVLAKGISATIKIKVEPEE